MSIEHDWPRAHLVVDDFFPRAALPTVLREVGALDLKMKPGLVREIGHDGQSVFFEHPRRRNKAVWIHDPSKTLSLFREHLWSETRVAAFDQAHEPLFQIIPHCWAPHLQVSAYMTGDHYDFHEDEGAGVNLTAIVFLAARPKKVEGGDLELSFDGAEATIPFRHNRLVIFPSRTLHRVTPVRVASSDPKDARVSLQCWLTHGRPAVKPRSRPPEADRPTFLLAEPAIIRAARALVTTTHDQTPEDLYWGAFYSSRILSSNLRALVAAMDDVTLGAIRIRRAGTLEVYGRGSVRGEPARIGFVLHGPDVAEKKALALFVEHGRGRTKSVATQIVPTGASEAKTIALMARLLARS